MYRYIAYKYTTRHTAITIILHYYNNDINRRVRSVSDYHAKVTSRDSAGLVPAATSPGRVFGSEKFKNVHPAHPVFIVLFRRHYCFLLF